MPETLLRCGLQLWTEGVAELRRRGDGRRESGAFLLGDESAGARTVRRFVYYDDLEPECLDAGWIVLQGTGYGPLWTICRTTGLKAFADVHTHPMLAHQSDIDRRHPMVAVPGHLALIIPYFAQRKSCPPALGVYEYLGDHRWRDFSGPRAGAVFVIDEEP